MAVKIEVLQFDCPGPVGVGQSGLEGSVREFSHPVVQVENIVHILAWNG